MTLKFVYPLVGHLHDDWENYDYDITSAQLIDYQELLEEGIEDYQTADGEGIWRFFDENADVESKLKSMVWGFEEFDGELYGITTVELTDAIDEKGIADLKEWISGQNSDGLGESFEQKLFDVDEGRLSVSLWNYHNYFIDTEDELKRRLNPIQTNANSVKSEKPECKLLGKNGNIFNLTGLASRTLREHGMDKEVDEMQKRVTSSNSYEEALAVIGDYVTII